MLFKNIWDKLLASKAELLSVSLIFVLATILRLIALNNCGGMWGDEEVSWYVASSPNLFMVLKETHDSEVHNPLYFILLHYWIQLFNDKIDTMRYLNFIITLPLIPFGYYAGKKLFNKTTGYYTAILLTVNTFCIYYCIEIRMYALNILLSLFSAYFFTSYLNNFKKRDAIFYIIFITLFIYNFGMAPLLAFCYFITGLLYLTLIVKKQEYLKKFITVNALVFIFSLPAIIWVILIAIRIHNYAILSVIKDIFPFKEYIGQLPLTFLENFFSLENIQASTTGKAVYMSFFEKLNPAYFTTVCCPILISLWFFTKALFSKNKNLYLIILPSLTFFIFLILLSAFELAALQVRYLTVIFPVVIIALAYGFSLFKIKEFSYTVFSLCIILMNFYLVFYDKSAYNIGRDYTNGNIASYLYKDIGLKSNDLLLLQFEGYLRNYYIKHNNIIPFYSDRMLYAAHKYYLKMYFGKDYKKYNRNNVKEYLAPEIFNNTPHRAFEENLYNGYIKNMNKGQRLILADIHPDLCAKCIQKQNPITKENYKDYDIEKFMYYKVHHDCYLIAKKYLKEVGNNNGIYIFEKE